jgi:SSS family solute:Na+ symporter
LNSIDLAIIALYFLGMIAAGVYHARRASSSVRSYFLSGNQEKWWMLAASGAASNFDVAGTMFLVSLFYVAGLRGFWMLWSWSFFNAAFLMSYMAMWIRRTGVVTAVELMKIRFGEDKGGRMARTAGGILMVTFLVFSIGYAYAGLSKFMPVLIPGVAAATAKMLAVLVIALTTLYVTLGGFAGVVLTDVIQLTLSSTAGIAIGVLVFLKLDAASVKALHANFLLDATPRAGMRFPPGYESWNSFGYLCIYLAVSGLLLNMSGAGGHYGEQRFLATRSGADAAKAGCAWGFFSIPRWAMIAGFVFLATSGLVGSADPEKILPVVIIQMIPEGLRGFLIAALLAAFMSSFSSTVNAAASIMVRDLVQPAKPDLSTKTLIRVSYAATVLIVVVGIAIGTQAESIKSIWVWMIAGVIGATLIPNVLRWHWWRFNGYGYAAGIFSGLGAATLFGVGQAFRWFGVAGLSEYIYAPIIWLTSVTGCVLGSLLTAATPTGVLETFYTRVRPFGFWSPVRGALAVAPRIASLPLVATQVVTGVLALVASFLSVFFLIGHYFAHFSVAIGIVLLCAVILYQSWYKRLPLCVDYQTVCLTPSESTWEGYRCERFVLDGRDCLLVQPDVPMRSNPWIWRPEFFGAFPALDLALLEAGFRVAYIDVQNMYGAPVGMRYMDRLYAHLTETLGLSKRCVLEGFSRGALFALNWAALHPQSVACLYLDAPVCDFKSWPAGKGRAQGSVDDWQRLKQAYALSEEQALAYSSNPIDSLAPIAAAGIPVIAVYGDADTGLPPEENILLLQSRYRALGGDITVIAKPGVGHHPHSLSDPTPLSRFILSRVAPS